MPATQPDAFLNLLRRAREGDAEAGGQLLEPHRERLTAQAERALGRRLRRKASVADVVQECFEEAYPRLHQFRGHTEAEFRAWLRRILASRIAAALKRYCFAQSRSLRLERQIASELDTDAEASVLVDPGTTPSQCAARNELHGRVREALERLPPDYAAVIRLRELEGLKFEQVARALGQTVPAVKGKHLRALLQLGRLLQGKV